MSKRAFAIAAHPDDIEFVMSGTMFLLAGAGYELHYLNIANGSCGSTEHDACTIAGIRRDEAIAAANYLGATYHESLTSDLAIFYERQTLARLASIFRDVAPEILLVHSPQDYMEDHMMACRLAVTAAFARGMPNFPVDPPRKPIDQDVTLYHAQPHGNCDALGRPVHPDFFIDITSVIDRKQAMLAKHTSQGAWLGSSQGMNSHVAAMVDFARDVGNLSGRFEFAEGWRRHYHVGFCEPDADPLTVALCQYLQAMMGQVSR
ncbi:MAG: PIG-L family deacetylase [Pirellulales bacterium]|nr:PIG-L family deacetylase [Pirellulales bacterium]